MIACTVVYLHWLIISSVNNFAIRFRARRFYNKTPIDCCTAKNGLDWVGTTRRCFGQRFSLSKEASTGWT